MNDLLLPEQTRLLHIGPHKTGTTALQGALQHARPELPAHGVVYPGSSRQHSFAARAALGRGSPRGDRLATAKDWDHLVSDVEAAGSNRVIISSETFANANAETARRVVERLGGPKVHVMVTLRPLVKIMPSAWQQYVREGQPASYERWLKGMLLKAPYDKPTPSFWRRHRHEELIDRWGSVVEPGNLTVIMLDEGDPTMLTRTVEELLGLPAGILKPEPGRPNRSLTYGEIELVRQLNTEFRARKWSNDMYRSYIRNGLVAHLQDVYEPVNGEGQIPTPRWALERITEIGQQSAEKISAMGVRIVGDISTLGAHQDTASAPERVPPPPALSVSLAAEAVLGVLESAAPHSESSIVATAVRVSETSSRELAGLLAQRISRRARSIRPRPRSGARQADSEGDGSD